jgi:hypothetical protein
VSKHDRRRLTRWIYVVKAVWKVQLTSIDGRSNMFGHTFIDLKTCQTNWAVFKVFVLRKLGIGTRLITVGLITYGFHGKHLTWSSHKSLPWSSCCYKTDLHTRYSVHRCVCVLWRSRLPLVFQRFEWNWPGHSVTRMTLTAKTSCTYISLSKCFDQLSSQITRKTRRKVI